MCWAAAYYLAGYAVECGLKACILRRLEGDLGLVFEERRFSEKCWTHDAAQLIELAGLKTAFDAERQANPELRENWRILLIWNELSRYRLRDKGKAEELYQAIADKNHGVMSWVERHW